MRLVKEEDELRLLQVAHLGQRGVQFREQPQQECGVELRLHHQLVGSQHAHHALAVLNGQQVLYVKRGESEEMLGTLILQLQQGTLYGTNRGGRDVAILGGVVLGVLRNPVEHGAQVLQVVNQQAALVGNAEHNVEHAVLRLVQLQQTRQQLRAHLADGGTHGVALFAEHVVETHGTTLELRVLNAELRQALLNEATQLAHLRNTTQVALHVSHEAGNACLTERLCHYLQRHGLTSTRGTGNESVAICHLSCNTQRPVSTVRNVKTSFFVVHNVLFLVIILCKITKKYVLRMMNYELFCNFAGKLIYSQPQKQKKMKKIRAAVVGYGNIGKFTVEALEAAPDFEIAGIVRRNGAADKPAELAPYEVVKDIRKLKDVDVAILATPTRSCEEYAKQILPLGINTVDSFDIHTNIRGYRERLMELNKQTGTVSIIAAGWDPGSDSIVRTLLQGLAPKGLSYTNFGPGMSMGHSVCVRSKAGVKNALSMTIPLGEGIHRRMVYVELEDGAKLEDVTAAIKADPYFASDETHVFAVESVDDVRDMGHGVHMVRKGVSGKTQNQRFEFNMSINNPALTAQVLVNVARASLRQQPGCYTMIEIPVIDMLPGERADLIEHLV